MADRLDIPARALLPGDIISSGETVTGVSVGVRTPRGKVEVGLRAADGRGRLAFWGASTVIRVRRPAAVSAIEDIDDAPACYSCGADEDLSPAGFPGQAVLVCPRCEASYQHQERLREEFALEGAGL